MNCSSQLFAPTSEQLSHETWLRYFPGVARAPADNLTSHGKESQRLEIATRQVILISEKIFCFKYSGGSLL
jgi:hypothetical protein